MKLIMLGTGHAGVTDYYNTCFLLHDENGYLLTDAGGEETVLNGFFSYDDYNEYCLLDMEKGMYQYTFSFDGTAETLEEAFSSGTFTDLAVREAAYSGLSDEVLTMLGLR